jgi:DNA-binding IclR family transcriptional regulator
MPDSDCPKGAQSIQRAISLLWYIAKRNERGVALSKIARQSGMNVATVHRILSVLIREGLITREPFSKLYHLGFGLSLLGDAAHQYSIRNEFRALLEDIAEETGNTVFLLIRSGSDALCIDRVDGKFPIQTVPINVGDRRPLGIGAGSLALIAFLPDDQLETFLSANVSRYLKYKKMTPKDVRNLTAISKKAGYVVSKGLFHEGVTSIGIPILNRSKEVIAAITVSSINQRMDKNRCQQIFRLVKKLSQLEGIPRK